MYVAESGKFTQGVFTHTKKKRYIGSNNRFYAINPPVTLCVKKKLLQYKKKKRLTRGNMRFVRTKNTAS